MEVCESKVLGKVFFFFYQVLSCLVEQSAVTLTNRLLCLDTYTAKWFCSLSLTAAVFCVCKIGYDEIETSDRTLKAPQPAL